MRILSVLFEISLAVACRAQDVTNPCPNAQPAPPGLKLPAFVPPGESVAVEKQLLKYVSTLDYRSLGWRRDRWVRDTGPPMQSTASIVQSIAAFMRIGREFSARVRNAI